MTKLLAVTVLTFAALGFAAPAAAGGWAVTTLDPLATTPVAGEPFDVGFTILQHGRTPITMPGAAIIVTDGAGAETRFPATPSGAEGHHVATVEIPVAGSFTWAVDAFGIQDLGPLHVATSATTSSGDGAASPWTGPLFVVAVVLAALGLVDLGRGTLARKRPPLAA